MCNKIKDVIERCKGFDVIKLEEVRDKEHNMIKCNKHYDNIRKGMFEKLIQIVVLVHIKSRNILEYFDWKNWRPTRFAQKSKLISNKKRKLDTMNAVLGINEKKLRQTHFERNEDKTEDNKRHRNVRD